MRCIVNVEFETGGSLPCPGEASLHLLMSGSVHAATVSVCEMCARGLEKRGGLLEGSDDATVVGFHPLTAVCHGPGAAWGLDGCAKPHMSFRVPKPRSS